MKKARELLEKYNLNPKKKFGQNFLIDDNVLRKIAKNYNPDYPLIEIGPGTGAMTQYFLEDPKSNVYLVEYDPDMINILNNEYSNIKEIFLADASKFDFSEILNKEESEFIVFGNLPYNVSSQIIFNLIKNIDRIDSCYFMVQKEVALRLTESKDNKNYSRLTVMTNLYFDKKILFDVKPNSFLPAPRVDSSIVQFKKKNDLLNQLKDRNKFAEIVKTAFSQRRKMLRNNLKPYKDFNLEEIIDLKQRAENLEVEDYIRITNHILSLS
jgi:16S rRNA (adenine1518-N6/adenine1519-N6)-dimethyltransferase